MVLYLNLEFVADQDKTMAKMTFNTQLLKPGILRQYDNLPLVKPLPHTGNRVMPNKLVTCWRNWPWGQAPRLPDRSAGKAVPAGQDVDEAGHDGQSFQGFRVTPADAISVVAGAEGTSGHSAAVIVDVEHCPIRSIALHISQPTRDLNCQPGLLGHLADHRLLIGLATFHPAPGH